MTNIAYRYVFLSGSVASLEGNGHAMSYRALFKALRARGHEVLFLQRYLPFDQQNDDLMRLSFADVALYGGLGELRDRYAGTVREADLVVVDSCVPEGAAIGTWIIEEARGYAAFYDLDTPATMWRLVLGDYRYLTPALIRRYDMYLSCTGGPTLGALARCHGARRVKPLYYGVDPELYYPEPAEKRWDLGYLQAHGDAQPLDRFLLEPARRWRCGRFVVAAPHFVASLLWPENVHQIFLQPPGDHRGQYNAQRFTFTAIPDDYRAFYNAQRFTLNVTRPDMVQSGWSPTERLFEAAACGTPILSDPWPGLEAFFQPGRELLLVRSSDDVLRRLRETFDDEWLAIARRARQRVFAEHTAAHRAETLERYTRELLDETSSERA